MQESNDQNNKQLIKIFYLDIYFVLESEIQEDQRKLISFWNESLNGLVEIFFQRVEILVTWWVSCHPGRL